jgi:RNA polymerase sigma-32 factor
MGTTSAQKKLFFNLRKAKKKIGAIEDGDLRPENLKRIAEELNVTEKEVLSMNRRMSGGDASLNAQVGDETEGTAEWQDWLEDDNADQASDYEETDQLRARRAIMEEAMDVLNEREADILRKRKLSEPTITLEELSTMYDVSRERIRQIEVRAFQKLQDRMLELARDKGMAA